VSYEVKSYEGKPFQRREATIRYQSVFIRVLASEIHAPSIVPRQRHHLAGSGRLHPTTRLAWPFVLLALPAAERPAEQAHDPTGLGGEGDLLPPALAHQRGFRRFRVVAAVASCRVVAPPPDGGGGAPAGVC